MNTTHEIHNVAFHHYTQTTKIKDAWMEKCIHLASFM